MTGAKEGMVEQRKICILTQLWKQVRGNAAQNTQPRTVTQNIRGSNADRKPEGRNSKHHLCSLAALCVPRAGNCRAVMG